VEKSMAKDPNQRYLTPQAMAEALAPWTETPIPPPPAIEMPQLSPAAMGFGPGESGVPGSGPPSGVGPVSMARKTWLVAGSGPSSVVPVLPPAVPPAPTSAPAVATPAVVAPVADAPSSQPGTRETRTDTSSLVNGPTPISGLVPITAARPPKPKSRPAVKTAVPRPAAAAPVPQTLTAPSIADESAPVDEESPAWGKLAGDTDDLTSRADTAPGLRRKPPSGTRPARPATPPPLAERRWFWWAVGGTAAGAVLLFLLVWWLLTPARRAGVSPRKAAVAVAARGLGAGPGCKDRIRSAANGAVLENRGL
jgi:hypothetical protein